jgi:hypothetical protein
MREASASYFVNTTEKNNRVAPFDNLKNTLLYGIGAQGQGGHRGGAGSGQRVYIGIVGLRSRLHGLCCKQTGVWLVGAVATS